MPAGESLNNDHVGMAKYFYVYKFSGNQEELIERRGNIKVDGDVAITVNAFSRVPITIVR